MPRFTRIPASTFNELQVNAGILVSDFDPATGTLDADDIITATSGGITISAKPSYEDYGSDIDNCPKNTKELKRKTEIDVSVSCTALNINEKTLKLMLGAADTRSSDGAIVTRTDLALTDFQTIWWIGDLADGGFLAIKLIDALSSDGFQLKTTDKGKGNLTLNMNAHMSLNAQDVEPVEFFLKAEGDLSGIHLNKSSLELVEDATETLIATTVPADASVTWASTDTSVATVSNGVVTAEAAGACVITAKITVDGTSYIDSCNVVVSAASEG